MRKLLAIRSILSILSLTFSISLSAHEADPNEYFDLNEFFEFEKSDSCSDITVDEITASKKLAKRLSGEFLSPTPYSNDVRGLQQYLDDIGVLSKFKAEEMVRPNNPSAAKACGYKKLLPPRCRWVAAGTQGLLASKLREVVNDGDPFGPNSISLRNWWRPKCYNSKVGGAGRSDHINARGFDLDFKTPKQRAIAQRYLCKLYKKKNFNLQVGIGCQTLHIGVGSPKRLGNFPKDGSRFWTYGSLQSCQLKRMTGDDCWRIDSRGKKYIHTKKSTSGAL